MQAKGGQLLQRNTSLNTGKVPQRNFSTPCRI